MAKKLKKAQKPSELDKNKKAKRTGYRFRTKGNPKLEKKDGTPNKKGEKLYYKKPTKAEIEKYKKKDGEYPDDTKQIYHERRADRTHSDDNLTKKFEEGGDVSEIHYDELKAKLGREPKYPNDYVNGVKYTKCFLKPYYKIES